MIWNRNKRWNIDSIEYLADLLPLIMFAGIVGPYCKDKPKQKWWYVRFLRVLVRRYRELRG